MFAQNLIKLRATVHELSWSQRIKNSDENNTAVATADSKYFIGGRRN